MPFSGERNAVKIRSGPATVTGDESGLKPLLFLFQPNPLTVKSFNKERLG